MNYPLIIIVGLIGGYSVFVFISELYLVLFHKKYRIKIDATVAESRWLSPEEIKKLGESPPNVLIKLEVSYEKEVYSSEVKLSYTKLPNLGEKMSVVFDTKNKEILIGNAMYSLFFSLLVALFMAYCLYTYVT